MRSLLASLPLLAFPALAQQILQFGSGQLPACAQSCQQLINAQTACISVPTTEHSCFCQSAYLTQQTNLYQTADGTCTDTCPQASDRQQIQHWFQGYCNNPNQNSAPQGNAQGQPPPSQPTDSSPAATTSSFAGTPVDQNNGSWWSEHARWIAMVIVLIIGFALVIVLGIWLKRRHDVKTNRATQAPLPAGWGPNSNPHAYSGPTEKASSRAHRPPPASASIMEEGRSRSQRLSKKFGRR